MRKIIVALLSFGLLLTLICTSVFAADAKEVTSVDELVAALGDESVPEIMVTADMEINLPELIINKDVTIASNVVFHPAPDDGFFVKSITIVDGGKLTITGKLETQSTFDEGLAIAQIYMVGGTLDASEGSVNDDFNICFDGGTIVEPKDGFNEATTIARYLYDETTEEVIMETLELEGLRNICVQTDCEINGELVIPEGKTLESSSFVIVNDGAGIKGNVDASYGYGYILEGNAYINDITADASAKGCIVINQGEGLEVYNRYDLQTWIDAKGEIENCAFILTVEDFSNPVYATLTDASGSVNLFGVKIYGEGMSLYDADIQLGDVLVLLNPGYNEFEGNVEMSEPDLVYAYKMTEEE